MSVQNVKISKLTLHDKNPRKITNDQLQKLCKSITDDPNFLQLRPILVNHTNDKYIVYAGNQRLRAVKKLGWKEVPCIIEDNLDDKIVKERTVKDNKTYGTFDFDLLANEYDIDTLLDAGFTPDELVGHVQDIEITDQENTKKNKDQKECPNCGCILN